MSELYHLQLQAEVHVVDCFSSKKMRAKGRVLAVFSMTYKLSVYMDLFIQRDAFDHN